MPQARAARTCVLPTPSFYADYRVRCGAVTVLQDAGKHPPENLVQLIWQHQRIRRDRLRTSDGLAVQVLHPGFRSVEGGPDFRGAVVQFGDDAPCSGDIEVDLTPGGWRAHGHDTNPAFAKVILHAVWKAEPGQRPGPPVVELSDLLDAPIGELSLWLGSESAVGLPEEWRGKCCAPLKQLRPEATLKLLHQAALVRLQSKSAFLQARAREAGWEQALWEGLFRALGYKHNAWPMQRIGELRPRWLARNVEPACLEARLFGIGGLLPADLDRARDGSGDYIRRIWDLWWRERESLSDCLLPKSLWRLHGVRPANHPHRRLALASRWSNRDRLPAEIDAWCTRKIPDAQMVSTLLQTLAVGPDDYWSWHHTLSSGRLSRPLPLLGGTRVTDLALNVILPWLWIRAAEGRNEALRTATEHRFFAWPAAEDNSVLKHARQRLLGSTAQKLFKGAAAQQGLIQIVRDFCDKTNSLCDHCQLPGMVEAYAKGEPD